MASKASANTRQSTMTTLRATAIMKTDIKGSTPAFRALTESDLSPLLAEHREFVSRLAAVQGGQIVKPEGDGFWITFPAVTAAGLAAMAMQEELRLAQLNKGDDRLAMRIVITLGDVLHREGALIGDAVVLAARIEALTPADEIYLSAAARLALNEAEIRTSLVDAFGMKGFSEPVAVYRIEQTHRTHVIKDQYILLTDVRAFRTFTETSPISMVEKVLDRLLELVDLVCREFAGTLRFSAGDSHCMTFADPEHAMAAAERLAREWSSFERDEKLGRSMNMVVHKGTLYAYRSSLYSSDLNVAGGVERATNNVSPNDTSVFVTSPVRQDLSGTLWHERLQRVDVKVGARGIAGIEIYRLGPSPKLSRQEYL